MEFSVTPFPQYRARLRRSGLTGERSLAERYYRGEYAGVTRMLFAAFEHFSPNWISDDRLRAIGDGRKSIKVHEDERAPTRPTTDDASR
jgi:hypothetical protein